MSGYHNQPLYAFIEGVTAEGTLIVKCPYCGKMHEHNNEVGVCYSICMRGEYIIATSMFDERIGLRR